MCTEVPQRLSIEKGRDRADEKTAARARATTKQVQVHPMPRLLACLTALAHISVLRAPKWHTYKAAPGGRPICEPYPGCNPPSVQKDLCPYTWRGEMCWLIRNARYAGVAHDALIVEVGSAFGMGIFTARHFGHPILGFECRADEYDNLRKQFAADQHVKLVRACVSDKPGVAKLYRAADSSSLLKSSTTGNAAAVSKASHENSTTEEVRMVTLDDMLSAVEVLNQPVGMIAIDVQGAEGLVLRGAKAVIQRHRPFILYEDTELKSSDREGRLLLRVLAEMGPDAPEYEPCYCERDCICRPRRDPGRDGSESGFQSRWWGPGSSMLTHPHKG
jgi:FkbM family methyltransferase